MKSQERGKLSFTSAIRKIKIHDFLKLNRVNNLQRKNLIKKKLIFLHRLKNDDEIDCPICMERIEEGEKAMTYCGHFFCFDCIKNVYNNYNHSCPICREGLNKRKIFLIET